MILKEPDLGGLQIADLTRFPGGDREPSRSAAIRRLWLAWLTAALALEPVAALVLGRATRPESRPVARYDVRTPVKTPLSVAIRPVLALSPDGATLVLVASAEGVPRPHVRIRDDGEARPLSDSEGAWDPTFSPDGK